MSSSTIWMGEYLLSSHHQYILEHPSNALSIPHIIYSPKLLTLICICRLLPWHISVWYSFHLVLAGYFYPDISILISNQTRPTQSANISCCRVFISWMAMFQQRTDEHKSISVIFGCQTCVSCHFRPTTKLKFCMRKFDHNHMILNANDYDNWSAVNALELIWYCCVYIYVLNLTARNFSASLSLLDMVLQG